MGLCIHIKQARLLFAKSLVGLLQLVQNTVARVLTGTLKFEILLQYWSNFTGFQFRTELTLKYFLQKQTKYKNSAARFFGVSILNSDWLSLLMMKQPAADPTSSTRACCSPRAIPTSVCFHLSLHYHWQRFSSHCYKHRFCFLLLFF